jgi:hypothetical protein
MHTQFKHIQQLLAIQELEYLLTGFVSKNVENIRSAHFLLA